MLRSNILESEQSGEESFLSYISVPRSVKLWGNVYTFDIVFCDIQEFVQGNINQIIVPSFMDVTQYERKTSHFRIGNDRRPEDISPFLFDYRKGWRAQVEFVSSNEFISEW